MRATSHQPKYPVHTVEKALEIIEFLKDSPGDGLGISSLSEKLGIGKSTVHRILDTLLAYGFVEKGSGNSKYRLSWKLFEIGSTIPRQRNLDSFDTKVLRDLCDRYNETVNLAIRVRDKAVIISKFDPLNVSVKANLFVGEHDPLHATALGKVLICEMDREEIGKIINGEELERFTNNTIASLDELMVRLEKVKEDGYALDEEEYSNGLSCLAMPVRNYDQEIIAAISISGPTFRLQYSKMVDMMEGLRKACEEFSQYLGGFQGTNKA